MSDLSNTKEFYVNLIMKLIASELHKDPAKIKPDSNLRDDLNVDSLDRVDLLCALEDKLGREIVPESDQELRLAFYKCQTVNDLAEMIQRTLEKQNG